MKHLFLSFILIGSMVNFVRAEAPTTRPADFKPTTPKQLVGKWIYGSVSPLTYWDRTTGQFQGNARGTAGIYVFDAEGNFRHYFYMEMRTYGLVTKVWTVYEGYVTFTADKFTQYVTAGHYNSESGSRKIDRDMTPEEREKATKSYNWKLVTEDGKEKFIIPFDDGSKFEYRREEEKK